MANIADYDAVIVGAGLGGLTAGAVLAKKGLKVHLIEPHHKVGGFATTFRRNKYFFEVAIHVIDGDQPEQVRKEVFDFLEVKKNIEFVKIPEFYECHLHGHSVKVPADFVQAKETLLKRFYKESHGINLLFNSMEKVYSQMNTYMLRKSIVETESPIFKLLFPDLESFSKISAGHFFDKLFNDPLLKATMLATVTFYHDNRYELSAIQYLYALSCYLKGGVYYVKGGSQVFSNYLAKIITDNGGKIDLNHRVTGIEINDDLAGTVYYRSHVKDAEVKETKGRFVVANAAMPMVYNQLLKSSKKINEPEVFKKAEYSTSATNIFFGLKKSLSELGNKSYLNIFLEPKINALDDSEQNYSFGLIDNHIVDTGICAPGVNTCEVIHMDQMKKWQNLDDLSYQKQKEVMAEYFIKRMNHYYPSFAENIDILEVGTPKTVVRYTSNPNGAIYGYRPDSESFYKRFNRLSIVFKPKDKNIKNLYFASAWSFMPGFSGSIISGYQASLGILDDLKINV